MLTLLSLFAAPSSSLANSSVTSAQDPPNQSAATKKLVCAAPDDCYVEKLTVSNGPVKTGQVIALLSSPQMERFRTRLARLAELIAVEERPFKDGRSDEMLKAFYTVVPMRRLGGSKDIAAAGVFLASPGASYTTGQDLKVDGGWSVW